MLKRWERPKSDEREKRILKQDELERLLAAVDKCHRLIFELASQTGARLGEVLGLIWNEVDFEGQTVTFTHQLNRRGDRVPLKTTRSRRTVDITPSSVATLREHKMASAFKRDDQLVFCTARGTGHDHRNIAGASLLVRSSMLALPRLRRRSTRSGTRMPAL